MEPKWLTWAREHMSPAMFAQMYAEWQHQASWRDDIIKRLETDIASLKAGKDAGLLSTAEVSECLDHVHSRMQEGLQSKVHCCECGAEQRMTPSGAVCPNGHGGAPSLEDIGKLSDKPCPKCGETKVYVVDLNYDLGRRYVCAVCHHSHHMG